MYTTSLMLLFLVSSFAADIYSRLDNYSTADDSDLTLAQLQAQYPTEKITRTDLQFERAVIDCRNRNTTLFIPNSPDRHPYELHHTLFLYDHGGRTCHIKGESKNACEINFKTTTDMPLFSFDIKRAHDQEGRHSSVRISDISLCNLSGDSLNSAIQLIGSDASIFENIYISHFNRGLDLKNDTNCYNEVNTFHSVRIDFCNFAICQRIIPGADLSFHGNNYNYVFVNLHDGQVGFYNEGYYYNGRFDLLMWTHGTSDGSTLLIYNRGFSDYNTGIITYETGGRKRLPGKPERSAAIASPRPAIFATSKFIFTGEIKSPNEKWFDDKSGNYTNGVIDKSKGLISWSGDTRLSNTGISKSIPKNTDTLLTIPVFPGVWSVDRGMSGVFSVTATVDNGTDYSYRTATLIIPGDNSDRTPIICAEGGADNSTSMQLRIETTKSPSPSGEIITGKTFQIRAANHTKDPITVRVSLKQIQ